MVVTLPVCMDNLWYTTTKTEVGRSLLFLCTYNYKLNYGYVYIDCCIYTSMLFDAVTSPGHSLV